MYKIIANWKMYLTIEESRNLAANLANWWPTDADNPNQLIICPSVLALQDVLQQLNGFNIQVGVQELSLSPQLGAFTGQIPAQQIQEIGAEYVIIGHSEMRNFFHVTDEMVAQQLHTALAYNLIPIVCIGETKEQRYQGKTDQIIVEQLQAIFSGMTSPAPELSIAYEPRWAIGTGEPVDPAEAARVHELIRHTLKEFYPDDNSSVDILYGGSVRAENINEFLKHDSIQGALIGSASAKPESLKALIDILPTS